MGAGVSVIIFEGAAAASPVEKMLVRVRQALLHDNLEKLSRVDAVEQIFLITNNPALEEAARSAGAEMILNRQHPEEFHFGRELKKLVLERNLQRVFYLSGAGCPLITVAELEQICQKLAHQPACFMPTTSSPLILSPLPCPPILPPPTFLPRTTAWP